MDQNCLMGIWQGGALGRFVKQIEYQIEYLILCDDSRTFDNRGSASASDFICCMIY